MRLRMSLLEQQLFMEFFCNFEALHCIIELISYFVFYRMNNVFEILFVKRIYVCAEMNRKTKQKEIII